MAAKRSSVVEGNTPGKPTKKRQFEGKSRRSLFINETETTANILNNASFAKKPENWSREETSTLVQYICLYWKDAWSDKWPMVKDRDFWDSCALTVNRVCQSARTGGSCRTRVVKHLLKEYASLSQTEASLKIDYVSGNDIICDDSVNYDAFTTGTPQRSTSIDEPLSPVFHSSPAMHENTTTRATGDIVKEFVTCYKSVSSMLY